MGRGFKIMNVRVIVRCVTNSRHHTVTWTGTAYFTADEISSVM